MLDFSSSWDTSTVSLTVVASRVSTALFTAVVSLGRGRRTTTGVAPSIGAPGRARGPMILRHPRAAPARLRAQPAAGSERLTGRVLGRALRRDGGIRTHDLPLPKRTRYQAAPHPVRREVYWPGGPAGLSLIHISEPTRL